MRQKRFVDIGLLILLTILTCGIMGIETVVGQETIVETELFGDINFERGFHVTSNGEFLGDFALPFQGLEVIDEPLKPIWGLATHASKFNISEGVVYSKDNVSERSTLGQVVALKRNDEGVVTLKLGVKTENEYSSPRRADQLWIHLLLTRDFPEEERVWFKDVDSIVFSCDARIPFVEKTDRVNAYNPVLHTTQASVYFALPNANVESEDYRDYIWFGVSFYDERYKLQEDYIAVDGDPKTIGTGKLIYRLGGQKTVDNILGGVNPNSGDWTHIEIDLKEYLPDAIKAAHKKGFLLHSTPDDFVVAHFNFGWETPGTYASDLEVKNVKLTARVKKSND